MAPVAEPSETEKQLHQFMEWWDAGNGQAAAKTNPILANIDESQLSEIVAAGGGYHNILTLDRLDSLHTLFGKTTEPQFEPMRKALLTRGGIKNQARAVGMMIFSQARATFDSCQGGNGGGYAAPAAPTAPAAQAAQPAEQAAVASANGAGLDEFWAPPRLYVCSSAFPAGASIAARAGPSKEAACVTTFPDGTEFLATGRKHEYLQIHFQGEDGGKATAYVPSRIGDLEILVAAAPPPQQAPVAAPQQPVQQQMSQSMPLPAATAASPPPATSRLEVLEARVAQQDRQLLSLQCEVAELRHHLSGFAELREQLGSVVELRAHLGAVGKAFAAAGGS